MLRNGRIQIKGAIKAIAKHARVVISKDCFKADNKQITSSAEYNYGEVPEISYQYFLLLNNVFFPCYSVKQLCISRDSLFHQTLIFPAGCVCSVQCVGLSSASLPCTSLGSLANLSNGYLSLSN